MTLLELFTRPLPPDSPHLERVSWPLSQPQLDRAAQTLLVQKQVEAPWFLRVFMAAGGWLVVLSLAIYSITLFAGMSPAKGAFALIAWGLVAVIAAVGGRFWMPGIFMEQLCLMAAWLGQVLVYVGALPDLLRLVQESYLPPAAAPAFLAYTFALGLYLPFPLFLSRLISCFLALLFGYLALLGDRPLILLQEGADGASGLTSFLLPKLFLVAVLFIFMGVFVPLRSGPKWRPLGYAATLFITLLVFLAGASHHLSLLVPFCWTCAAALIAVIVRWEGGWERFKSNLFLWVELALGLVVLGLFGFLPLLWPLLLWLVGFGTQNRFLYTLGALLTPVFLGDLFYEFNAGLGVKEETLTFTTVVLLLARAEVLWLTRTQQIKTLQDWLSWPEKVYRLARWRESALLWITSALILTIFIGLAFYQPTPVPKLKKVGQVESY